MQVEFNTVQNIVGHVKFPLSEEQQKAKERFCLFLAMPPSLQDLSFPTGNQTKTFQEPHWTTKESHERCLNSWLTEELRRKGP